MVVQETVPSLGIDLDVMLDTHLGEQVMELIRSELNGRGTTAIVVTHDDRMTHYCDRVVRIVDGVLTD